MVGGGLFPSPPVTKKSPTPTEKSPTVISKRCWTLEFSGELEFSSPFMEQWTLDTRGVVTHILEKPSHTIPGATLLLRQPATRTRVGT